MKRKLAALLVLCSIIVGLNATVTSAEPTDSQTNYMIFKPNSHGFGG